MVLHHSQEGGKRFPRRDRLSAPAPRGIMKGQRPALPASPWKGALPVKHTLESRPSWVQDLVVYQIYPRSFQDSNGDGVGDLPGICRRLDYLQSLGVNALWLSPVYRSPNDDNGYDISGYQEIMEEFGTMADWEALRDGCRARGIRLIMDLVVNHSSDEHPWFAESRSSRATPKANTTSGTIPPLTGGRPTTGPLCSGAAPGNLNWRGQYYLHIFSKKQPDLNWACKALREELLAMMDWWAQRGVDGFRVDAISYLEKPQGFPNSPLPPQPDGYSLFNNWAAGSEGTHRYIRMMHDQVFGPRGLVTVGEVSLNAPEEIASYVDPGPPGIHHGHPLCAPLRWRLPPGPRRSCWQTPAGIGGSWGSGAGGPGSFPTTTSPGRFPCTARRGSIGKPLPSCWPCWSTLSRARPSSTRGKSWV